MIEITENGIKIQLLQDVKDLGDGSRICKTSIAELSNEDLLILADHIDRLRLMKTMANSSNDDDVIEDAIY